MTRPSFWRLMRRERTVPIGLFLLLAAGLALLAGRMQERLEADYAARGGVAVGIVIEAAERAEPRFSAESAPIYTLRYRFRAAGEARDRIGEAEVSRALFQRHAAGDPIEIAYLRGAPGRNRPAATLESGGGAATLQAIALGAALIAAALIAVGWTRAARLRRLALTGRAEMGEIRAVERVGPHRRRGWGGGRARLRYSFVGPDGATREGASRPGPARRFAAVRPGDGATVIVDPDAPERHAWSGDLD